MFARVKSIDKLNILGDVSKFMGVRHEEKFTDDNTLFDFVESTPDGKGKAPAGFDGGSLEDDVAALIETEDFKINFEDLELGRPFASGAGGTVFRGKYIGQECAIKECHTALGQFRGPDTLETLALKREITFVARLRHPNIVACWGSCVGGATPRLYMAMEFCPENIETILKNLQNENKKMKKDRFIKYFQQISSALTFLHGIGIIHRDIKPGNLLVDSKGDLKLCDLGLARDTKRIGEDEQRGKNVTMNVGPFFLSSVRSILPSIHVAPSISSIFFDTFRSCRSFIRLFVSSFLPLLLPVPSLLSSMRSFPLLCSLPLFLPSFRFVLPVLHSLPSISSLPPVVRFFPSSLPFLSFVLPFLPSLHFLLRVPRHALLHGPGGGEQRKPIRG
jgi:serine/threonine protein kinase